MGPDTGNGKRRPPCRSQLGKQRPWASPPPRDQGSQRPTGRSHAAVGGNEAAAGSRGAAAGDCRGKEGHGRHGALGNVPGAPRQAWPSPRGPLPGRRKDGGGSKGAWSPAQCKKGAGDADEGSYCGPSSLPRTAPRYLGARSGRDGGGGGRAGSARPFPPPPPGRRKETRPAVVRPTYPFGTERNVQRAIQGWKRSSLGGSDVRRQGWGWDGRSTADRPSKGTSDVLVCMRCPHKNWISHKQPAPYVV